MFQLGQLEFDKIGIALQISQLSHALHRCAEVVIFFNAPVWSY